jgi:hypothetical protein
VSPIETLGTWVAVWIGAALLILIFEMQRPSAGTGLVMSYLASLALNHLVGGAIYLVPWYHNLDADIVAIGFQQSALAVAAFAIGSVVLAPLATSIWGPRNRRPYLAAASDPPRPQLLVVIGAFSLLGLRPLVGRVPTVSSFVSQGWGLLLVGIAIGAWQSWRARKPAHLALWLAGALSLPLFTVVGQGFLGFGTVAAVAVLTFIASFTKPGWKGVLLACVMCYFGLSVFVTYMRDRLEIRDVVWTNGALGDRVSRVYDTFTDFEWLDLSNVQHLSRIDERLNQNTLVGKAASYIDSGLATYANGSTFADAVFALVPRALWPTKPVAAGSGDLVSQYTGIIFAEGTSVGIGNVMEAYINFGSTGVIAVFALLGVVIALVDRRAGQHLSEGNWRSFVRWYLPGLSLLQVGGSFVELTSSVGTAIAVGYLVTRVGSAAPRAVERTKPVFVAGRT